MKAIAPIPQPGSSDFWTRLDVHIHQWQVQRSRSLGQRARRTREASTQLSALQRAALASPQLPLPL